MPDLLVEVDRDLGIITLNRPERINALTHQMVTDLGEQLVVWRDDDRIAAVELRGAGERGFCAGADVRALRDAVLAGRPERMLEFLYAEYDVDALIADYPKPVTAHLVGIAMGGGLGIGQHTSRRVGGLDTRWAMPENAIGLWPDVGVCFELSRTPGRLGEHLAMTGGSLDGASALWAGLLDECPGVDPRASAAALAQDWIDECYRESDAVQIVAALESHPNPDARSAAETIRARAPFSVHVALEAVRRAAGMASVAEVLMQDRALGRAFTTESWTWKACGPR